MKNQTPTKMTRIRYVGGNNVKITNGTHFIHSEDSIEFSSLKKIYDNGETTGSKYGNFEERQIDVSEYIIDGEWLDKDGKTFKRSQKQGQITSDARIGDVVYFKIKTQNLPLHTPVTLHLMEYDGSIFLPLGGGMLMEARPFDDSLPFFDIRDKNKEVIAYVDADGFVIFSIHLTEMLEKYIDEDAGVEIELYFICTYKGIGFEKATLPRSTEKYLTVRNTSRTIFIKPAAEKYKLPEFRDSLGDFIVFLANESGAVVGDFDSTIQNFHTVKVRVFKEFQYHSNFNSVTTKIYEQTYNMDTGLDTHEDLFEETEKKEFRIKKDGKQIFQEGDITQNVKKSISDYYNVNDIGKTGLKGLQESLEILGYLDYFNDLKSIANGEKVPVYDAVGVVVNTAEIAAKAAGSPIKIPFGANAVMFGLAVFEATIVAGVIRDMDDFVENAMMVELENAKLKGLEGIRKLFRNNDYFSEEKYNYRLIRDVPQEILNDIFTGKRKKYDSISSDLNKYPFTNQRYDLLFKILPENEKIANFRYLLETIIIH